VRGLFFKPPGQFLPSLLDDGLGILLGKNAKPLISGDGFLKSRNLIPRDVMGNVFTVFPKLVIVVRPVGCLPEDAEFPTFHVLDLSQLLEE
jgi:hypothetical protein